MPDDMINPEGSEEDLEQPEGSEIDQEQPDGEGNVDDQESVIQSILAETGFRDLNSLVKSYKESQKKITELGQGKSELEKYLIQSMQQGRGIPQETPQKPELDPNEMTAKELDEFLENPSAYMNKKISEAIRKEEEEKELFTREIGRAYDIADQILMDDGYDKMTDEEIAEFEKIVESGVVKETLGNISLADLKRVGTEGIGKWMSEILRLSIESAKGRVSKSSIRDNEIKAKRDAKIASLRKQAASGALRPTAKRTDPTKMMSGRDDESFFAKLRGVHIPG